jgi:hypothetical protein
VPLRAPRERLRVRRVLEKKKTRPSCRPASLLLKPVRQLSLSLSVRCVRRRRRRAVGAVVRCWRGVVCGRCCVWRVGGGGGGGGRT